MTTFSFHKDLIQKHELNQITTHVNEINFHNLRPKLRFTLEKLHILVQGAKINFIIDREGSYDL